MAQLNFDANQVAPDAGHMDPVPAGWYNAAIDQSDMKPTKDGSGAYLELRFTILDGQYVNRKLYARLNLRNANQTASEIAYKQLSAICHSVGVIQVADSQQLHGRPLKIRVKVRAATGEYEASNDITSYKNIAEVVESTGNATAPWGTAAPQQAPQQAPWAAQQVPPSTVAPTLAPQVQQGPWAGQSAQVAPAAQAPAPQWTPPNSNQPWEVQQGAQTAPVQQAPAAPAQPPHPTQSANPPWNTAPQEPAAGSTPPWAQQ